MNSTSQDLQSPLIHLNQLSVGHHLPLPPFSVLSSLFFNFESFIIHSSICKLIKHCIWLCVRACACMCESRLLRCLPMENKWKMMPPGSINEPRSWSSLSGTRCWGLQVSEAALPSHPVSSHHIKHDRLVSQIEIIIIEKNESAFLKEHKWNIFFLFRKAISEMMDLKPFSLIGTVMVLAWVSWQLLMPTKIKRDPADHSVLFLLRVTIVCLQLVNHWKP